VEARTHPKVVGTGFPAATGTANAAVTGTVGGSLIRALDTYTIRLALQQQWPIRGEDVSKHGGLHYRVNER